MKDILNKIWMPIATALMNFAMGNHEDIWLERGSFVLLVCWIGGSFLSGILLILGKTDLFLFIIWLMVLLNGWDRLMSYFMWRD